MANKNTKRARKAGFSNQAEITIGSGAGRTFGVRNAEAIIKGAPCNTARPAGKKKWVGALKAGQGNYDE